MTKMFLKIMPFLTTVNTGTMGSSRRRSNTHPSAMTQRSSRFEGIEIEGIVSLDYNERGKREREREEALISWILNFCFLN